MSTVIEDFFVALGFQINADELAAFDQQVQAANETLVSIGTAAVAAAASIFAFVVGVDSGIDDLNDFATANDVSIESLQEYGFAAQQSGSSLEAIQSSIAGVNQAIGDAALGVGRGAALFKKLGIDAKDADGKVKGFDDIMQEVGDRFVGLSKQEQIALASKLGIDSSLIPLLSQGSAGIAKLREEARALGVVSQEDADSVAALNDTIDKIKFTGLEIARTIAVALTPAILSVVEGFQEWLRAARPIIGSSIGQVMGVLTNTLIAMFGILSRLVGTLGHFVLLILESKVAITLLTAAAAAFIALNVGRSVLGIATALRGMAASAAAVNLALFAVPIAIGLVVAAIGLLIDDFLTFQEGGDSVIGGLVEKFPMIGDAVRAVGRVVQDVFSWWKGLATQVMGSLGPLVSSLVNLALTLFNLLWPVIKTVFQGWAEIIGLVLPPLAAIATFIIDVVAAAITFAVNKMTAFVDKIKGAADFLSEFFGQGSDVNVNASSTTKSTGLGVPRTGASVVGGNQNTTANSTTTSNVITAPITVVTSDPAKAGESVKKELDAMNKQTTRNGQTATKL